MPLLEMFWMVKAENRSDTTVQHRSLQSARAEAERLAREHPNVRFFVLQCVGAARVEQPTIWMEARAIPF